MMKKANVLVVPTTNGVTSTPATSPSCSAHVVPASKNGGLPAPTIVVSDTATSAKGGLGINNDGSRSPDRRKEKKEKVEKERSEKEKKKKVEKEQKKSKGDSKEGKLDRFLGSKVTMEKFFKKKIKEREERKEKEKEERERERILAAESQLSDENGEGGDVAKDEPKDKEKKKKEKKDKKDKKKKALDYYYEASSSGRDDEDSGADELKRKKKRKKASSSSSSSTPDKDLMEREAEREDEREEESKGGSSDDSSSGTDDSDESEEERQHGGKNLLRADGTGGAALRPQRRRKKDWTVSQEFRVLALETEEKQKPDFSFALQHKNRDKNRYGNALPNPETRVVLKGGDTDYINANYIQGEQTQYIAAQAPLPNTFGDFWLMVWEQNTRVIMMLTRLTENDRTKAEIYWPRKGPLGRARGSFSSGEDGGWKQYGKMRVSLSKSTLLEGDEDVTIRYFRLRNDDEPDVERQVIQIHFTGWPDFGVPQNTKAFIKLLEMMESFNKEPTISGSTDPNGPIILHCSAGLGRTGTLIAAHIAAEKLKLSRVGSKEDIDMKAIVAQLREQRSGMVQTKCQYKFLHDLLNDL